MARALAREAPDWPATRARVLDRYGATLGRAILARVERSDGADRHRSPHTGSVVLVVDKRSGYATFRGRVLWRGRRYEVYQGVPATARSLKPHADKCRADLTSKIRELEAGTAAPRDKEKTTLREWAVAWLRIKAGQVRATTMVNYEGYMRLHVLPALGHVRLADLTPEMIQELYRALDGTLSRTAIRALATCLKTCLREAVGYPVSPTLFSKATRAPRVPKGQKFVATPAMLRQLLDATRGDREHALWHVAVWTGGRLSEPLATRWPDYDDETGALVIDERLSGLSTRDAPDLDEPKSGRARVVYLPAEARGAMRAHKAIQEREMAVAAAKGKTWPNAGPFADLIFRSTSGRHLIHVTARYYWHRALKKAKLPDFPIRQLRHSLATNLGLVGVAIEDVSDILGHTEITTTDRHYRQQLPAKTRAAIDALADMMGASK